MNMTPASTPGLKGILNPPSQPPPPQTRALHIPNARPKNSTRSVGPFGKSIKLVSRCVFATGVIWLSELVDTNNVQKAVKDKGLDVLLQQAREEHPLTEPPPPPANSQSNAKKA